MSVTKQRQQKNRQYSENNDGTDNIHNNDVGGGGNDEGEQQQQQQQQIIMTMDTPNPTPIEPPPEAFAEMTMNQQVDTTNAVAVPIISDNNHNNNNGNPSSSSPQTCVVYAPSTLGPGYSFPACVDGIDFIVTVPDGGVREGEAFEVPYPTPSASSRLPPTLQQRQQQQHNPSCCNGIETDRRNNNNNVPNNSLSIESTTTTNNLAPMGRWRNGLCDCCEVLCNGLFWQGFCCVTLLYGQIMTRLRLNLCGRPVVGVGVNVGEVEGEATSSTTTIYDQTFFVLLLLWLILLIILFVSPETFGYLFIPYVIYVTYLAASTRYKMRQKYRIPVSHCKGCNDDGKINDCCCGFWCLCCTGIQMARHTHSEKEYPYKCCSTTGLDNNAPVIPA